MSMYARSKSNTNRRRSQSRASSKPKLSRSKSKHITQESRKNDRDLAKIFLNNKTAWFSSCCDPRASKLWVKHGGHLVDQDFAQYLFSESWKCPDMKQLMQAEVFREQRIACFSSKYVLDVVKMGIKSVALGDYFLMNNWSNRRQNQRLSGMVEEKEEGDDDLEDLNSIPIHFRDLETVMPGKNCIPIYLES